MVEKRQQGSDDETAPYPLTRRQMIASGSTVGALALAGCGSGSSSGGNSSGAEGNETNSQSANDSAEGGGQASFDKVNLTGPENATVDEAFNLSLSVTNSGGENGTFNGTVTVDADQDQNQDQDSNHTQKVEIEDVAPNQSGTADVGPFNFSTAANYTISIDGQQVNHSISAEPITLSRGDSHPFKNGIRATVESVSFQPAIHYDLSPSNGQKQQAEVGLFQAKSDQILMVTQVSLENTGNSEAVFTPQPPSNGSDSGSNTDDASVYPAQGSVVTSFGNVGLEATKEIDGDPIIETPLSAGEKRSGWLLSQVPRKAAAGSISLIHQRDAADGPAEVAWKIPPKQGSKRSLPQFTLEKFKMESPREITDGAAYTVTVKNEGDGPGTFRGLLAVGGDSSGSSQLLRKLSTTIKPGSSKSIEGTHDRPYLGTKTYQLTPFDKSATVETVAAKRPFGAAYTTPKEQKLAVQTPKPTDRIAFEGGAEETADDGNQFVPVPVKMELGSDAEEPRDNRYRLQANGQSYEPEQVQYGYPVYVDPVSGRKYQRMGIDGGQTMTGILLFETPSGITTGDMTIEFQSDEDESESYAAIWGESSGRMTSSTGSTTQN